jgi:hypothetical protein
MANSRELNSAGSGGSGSLSIIPTNAFKAAASL